MSEQRYKHFTFSKQRLRFRLDTPMGLHEFIGAWRDMEHATGVTIKPIPGCAILNCKQEVTARAVKGKYTKQWRHRLICFTVYEEMGFAYGNVNAIATARFNYDVEDTE
jgi:hypothetical protein